MKIHKAKVEMHGAGRWDKATGRYVPLHGGSRTRLPVFGGDSDIPRYCGFVPLDEKLTEEISTIKALYQHIGGAPKIDGGKVGTLAALIQEVTLAQRKAEEDALAAAAKAAQVGPVSQPHD
jgi:hypothetical protein